MASLLIYDDKSIKDSNKWLLCKANNSKCWESSTHSYLGPDSFQMSNNQDKSTHNRMMKQLSQMSIILGIESVDLSKDSVLF